MGCSISLPSVMAPVIELLWCDAQKLIVQSGTYWLLYWPPGLKLTHLTRINAPQKFIVAVDASLLFVSPEVAWGEWIPREWGEGEWKVHKIPNHRAWVKEKRGSPLLCMTCWAAGSGNGLHVAASGVPGCSWSEVLIGKWMTCEPRYAESASEAGQKAPDSNPHSEAKVEQLLATEEDNARAGYQAKAQEIATRQADRRRLERARETQAKSRHAARRSGRDHF
eukprot:TRINITY_DN42754_c0_g1_i1.p1 TRINITY_DN42754_c0_g1~~TRINITY_DN42754_c0_g1_i1.p1  ORF type:complete len:237 (+),score=42.09 TRINITY_DN42754_c0_g1_i1:45-713(+)